MRAKSERLAPPQVEQALADNYPLPAHNEHSQQNGALLTPDRWSLFSGQLPPCKKTPAILTVKLWSYI
jgi:hypothetical protein